MVVFPLSGCIPILAMAFYTYDWYAEACGIFGRDKRSVKEYLVHPPQWIGIIFLSLPKDPTKDCGLYKSMQVFMKINYIK